ncbi:hypothetical protein [Bacteroides sp.]|uniref:hypothetical protein n=1 Tax=Bacteroides sp. TaxID=29523 RepID=UPI00258F34E8|nr:hypothetical protein [Bacteroides sp.]
MGAAYYLCSGKMMWLCKKNNMKEDLKTCGDGQVRLRSVIQCCGTFPWQISRQKRYEERIVHNQDGSSKIDTPILKVQRNNTIEGYD